MKRVFVKSVWMVAVLMLSGLSASADVRLPTVISDNMVLQHGRKVPIWGWAEPNEKVKVSLEGKTKETVAGTNGHWRVDLPAHAPGGPFVITIAGKNTITIKNVMFGEVWVCSGASNMAWGVGGSASPEDIAKMVYPNIRTFFMLPRPYATPQPDALQGNWRAASPETVGEFPAVGFWFALKLQEELGVPVGLINASTGSTSYETWTPREALEGDPDFAPMFERLKGADMPKLEAAYKAWEAKAEEARAKNQPEPPDKPLEPKEQYAYIMRHAPGTMFNGMVHPVIPFGIRGAFTDGNRSNTERAYLSRKVLPALITGWRKLWNQGDFPFVIVENYNFGGTGQEPRESEWAELREAQAMTARNVKHCGVAVTIDIGDAKDIHPKNKWDAGSRAALFALATVYGQKLEYSGPVLDFAKFKGSRAMLKFSHADGGLSAGKDGSDTPLRGFAVAGADRKFAWAETVLDGNTVTLTSTNVPKPVAVRYAWDDNPACNLYNKAGLPAVPFRTDDWPGITVGNK